VPPSAQAARSPQGGRAEAGQAKRAGLVLQGSSRKRARTANNDGDDKEEGDKEEGDAEGQEEEGRDAVGDETEGAGQSNRAADEANTSAGHVTTITNHNQRAQVKLQKKLDTARAKQRLARGLVEPGKGAPKAEHAAYASLPLEDEPTISWIFKQELAKDDLDPDAGADFYSGSPTPYVTATQMLKRARGLGDATSMYCASQFIAAWREQGTPFRAGTDERRLVASSQAPVGSMAVGLRSAAADDRFCFAWDMCKRFEMALASVHIGYRWAFALLGRAYAQKREQLSEADALASSDRSRNRYGKGQVRSEAIAALASLVFSAPTKKDLEVFNHRLRQGRRWYAVVKGLGWGSLLLMSPELVTNWWLQSKLHTLQLNVFIKLVKREQPDLCAASRALEEWLGADAIAGGPIHNRSILSIETHAPASLYEVVEVPDSEDEEDSLVLINDLAEPESSVAPVTLKKHLRQRKLTELFTPR